MNSKTSPSCCVYRNDLHDFKTEKLELKQDIVCIVQNA